MIPANTVTERSIGWSAAQHAVLGAVTKAQQLGVLINAAVVDRGGNLLAFIRMNGAFLHSISIAEDKAFTALSFGFPTEQWGDILGDDHNLREGLLQRNRLVMIGGGLPLKIDGELIGAIGVSGASEEQDQICAQAGADSIGDR